MRFSLPLGLSRKAQVRKHLLDKWDKTASESIMDNKTRKRGWNYDEDGKKTTRRTLFAHIVNASLYSHTLERNVKLSLSTGALRTIDKYGGIDNYVLNRKENLIGDIGKKHKNDILAVQDSVIQKRRQLARQLDETTSSATNVNAEASATTV